MHWGFLGAKNVGRPTHSAKMKQVIKMKLGLTSQNSEIHSLENGFNPVQLASMHRFIR